MAADKHSKFIASIEQTSGTSCQGGVRLCVDKMSEWADAGALDDLERVLPAVVNAVADGDQEVIQFVRRALALENGVGSMLASLQLASAALRSPATRERWKLIHNLVTRDANLCAMVWSDLINSPQLPEAVKAKVEPALAVVYTCLCKGTGVEEELIQHMNLVVDIIECCNVGDDKNAGTDGADWALLVISHLVRSLSVRRLLKTLAEDPTHGTSRLLALVDYLGSSEVPQSLRVTYTEDDIAALSELARKGNAQALTCLGTRASEGVPNDNAVQVAKDGLECALGMPELKGAKSAALRLLCFAVYGRKNQQDQASQCGAIPLVLSCMGIDEANPMMREWAVVCVRNLCENNTMIQNEISSYELREAAESDVLRAAGLEAQVGDDGKLRFRKT